MHNGMEHFGISNVKRRLNIIYGDAAEMEVQSVGSDGSVSAEMLQEGDFTGIMVANRLQEMLLATIVQ